MKKLFLLLFLLACTEEPVELEPICTLVVVSVYGDTTRFEDYQGPPPSNLFGVASHWWENEDYCDY